MSMEITIQPSGSDQTFSISPEELAESFNQQGYQSSLTPDRGQIRLVDSSGETGSVDIAKYLEGRGDKIISMTPQSANYDSVKPEWRAAIEKLGDPRLQKAYLQSALEIEGVKDVQIMGQGSDYYFYDPRSGRYNALTNKPGFDFSDAAGFVPQAAEFAGGLLGSVGGGVVGAGAGAGVAGPLGSIGGGAFGSMLGGSAGRGITDQVQSWFQPELRPFLESEEFQSKRDQEGLIDAFGGGFAGGLPALFNRSGIASTVAKNAGGFTEKAGKVVGDAGAYLSSEATPAKMARGIAENFVPVTGQFQLPAMVARAGELIPGAVKKYGERGMAKTVAPTIDELVNMAPDLKNTARKSLYGQAKWDKIMASRFVPEAEESAAQKFANSLAGKPGAVKGVRPATGGETVANLSRGSKYENIGKSAGNLLDVASQSGRAVDKVNEKAVLAATRSAQGLGRGVQGVGKIAKDAGTALAPVENRMFLQGGLQSDDFNQFMRDRQKKRLSMGQQLGYE